MTPHKISQTSTSAQQRIAFCYLVYFISGMPSLMYQVIWQRTLTLYFGVDIYSVAITVAVFMLGLGIGALLGGQIADRTRVPARVYALVELLIAASGAFSIPLFSAVGNAFAGSPLWNVLLIDFALLLLPTTLMGMTMPLMSRVVAGDDRVIGRHLSRLYALNTLGAAIGALVSAYLLIGLLGLQGAAFVGAGLNVLLAALMFPLARSTACSASLAEQHSSTESAAPAPALLTYGEVWFLSFASGFIALGYQLAWYRVLGCILHGTVYVFGTILFFFLLGIAAGSLRARRKIDTGDNARRFAASQLAISVYVLLTFLLLGYFSSLPGMKHLLAASNFTSFHPSPELAAGNFDVFSLYSVGGMIAWVSLLLIVPTYYMGLGFPNLLREASRTIAQLGRSVGGLYFANIVGSTAGSLFVGFIQIHYFGTASVAMLMCVLGAASALYIYQRDARSTGRSATVPSIAVALVLAASLFVFPSSDRLLRAIHYSDFPGVVDYVGHEDRTGVAVLRRQQSILAFPQEERVVGDWRLYIDGGTHGEFEKGVERLLPDLHLQMSLTAHPMPRRVLSIGLGDGRMCESAALDPRVEKLVIVELNGVLRKTLESSQFGKDLFDSDKIEYHIDDGRRWMLANPAETFDFIMMWPLHAAHAFNGSLYSREFMQLLKSRLSPGGTVMMRSADAFSTAHTIANEFPHVARIGSASYICALEPIVFHAGHLPEGKTADDLARQIKADRQTILQNASAARLNSDFVLNSEYYLTYRYARSLQTRIPFAVYEESDRTRIESTNPTVGARQSRSVRRASGYFGRFPSLSPI